MLLLGVEVLPHRGRHGRGQLGGTPSCCKLTNRYCRCCVLALDTTTRAGSVALWSTTIASSTSARRCARARTPSGCPASCRRCWRDTALALADIDLFAVASGPGSFTGLRIGIATIQGLAFVHGRRVVAVSALEALAHSGASRRRRGRHD